MKDILAQSLALFAVAAIFGAAAAILGAVAVHVFVWLT